MPQSQNDNAITLLCSSNAAWEVVMAILFLGGRDVTQYSIFSLFFKKHFIYLHICCKKCTDMIKRRISLNDLIPNTFSSRYSGGPDCIGPSGERQRFAK